MAKVTVIPSTMNPITQRPLNATTLKKVAAYARVSTNSDEQYTSYEAQVNYYSKLIQDRPDWEYTKVYADEGLSGTTTKRRIEFNRMIQDAMNGDISLIITKSISRFARNTLDTISYVRKLKEKGIEVFFEKENLWTLDPKSELILTIMASIAQEESRSISQNVTWGKRVGFQQGKVSFAYKSFLGYKKEDDEIVIDEDQAFVVRMIYRMFLVEGKTGTGIANYLKSHNIKTPTGKNANWSKNGVMSILTNEKYKGDALLQKTYTVNYLEHTKAVNNGQIPQYYVENNHPAIIDKETWEEVQIEIVRRKELGRQYSSSDIFASKLICEDCGGFYGKKKWHSTSKYSKFIYRCNNKYGKNKDKCSTPNLSEEDIKVKFIEAYNTILLDRDRIIEDTYQIIKKLTNTEDIITRINELNEELLVLSELVKNLIQEHSKSKSDNIEFNDKYDSLNSRFENCKEELQRLTAEKNIKDGKALKMTSFIKNFQDSSELLSNWNEHIWRLLVESAIVHNDKTITFRFKDGTETTI